MSNVTLYVRGGEKVQNRKRQFFVLLGSLDYEIPGRIVFKIVEGILHIPEAFVWSIHCWQQF